MEKARADTVLQAQRRHRQLSCLEVLEDHLKAINGVMGRTVKEAERRREDGNVG